MTESILLRAADTSDATAISRLFRRSYPHLLPGDYSASLLRAVLPLITTARPSLLSTGTYYVATDTAGQVIGAGGWTDVSPTNGLSRPGEGHVRHVAVDPAHLRRGIAGALLRQGVRSALDAGIKRLKCMSTLTAVPFYKAAGFREVSSVDLTLAPGVHFPAVEMLRDLT